jgi:hypothetical protein
MLARDDQAVKGRLGVDIAKGDHPFILVHPFGGDFTLHNLAEQTFHNLLSMWLSPVGAV